LLIYNFLTNNGREICWKKPVMYLANSDAFNLDISTR